MNIKTIDLTSYKLHMIKTNKFKSIQFKIIFRDEIKKEEITLRNILLDNLIFSCKKYPTKKELQIKKQDLYGADIYGYNKRIGNHFLTEISMSILNPKYTEDIMLEESISFFKDIIFDANVENNKFNENIFNIIKKNTETDIKSLKENPSLYASTRLKEIVAKDKAFAYRIGGYVEDLDDITPESLYRYYLKLLKTNIIDLYVVGDIDFYETEKLIRDNFNFKTVKKDKIDIEIDYQNLRKKENVVVEDSNFNQSKLVIGCSLNNLTKKEKDYVLTIYNVILGNSPDSKFFKNIREKNSYAYSIGSGFKKSDNLMLINAGISYNNFDHVVSLIKNEMNEMVKGNFSTYDINKAKEVFLSVLNDVYEYQDSILDYYFGLEYLDIATTDEQIKNIKSITKEDIINLSKKIKIDTIYLLKEKASE